MPLLLNRFSQNRFRSITFAQNEVGNTEPGGIIHPFKAAATLTVGQAVIFDANGEVVTDATAANAVNFVGIVVGGKQTNYELCLGANQIGVQAALADETVLVMVHGICYGVADDTITIATRVGLAATAGQVNDATGTEYSVALALSAGANDGAVLLLLNGIQVEVAA